MLFIFFLYLIPLSILLAVVRFICYNRREKFRASLRQKLNRDQKFAIVGFFHPYCNAGGGGERVLWMAIKAVQQEYAERVVCVVYTGDSGVSAEGINQKLRETFNIELTQPIEVVYLKNRWLIEDKNYSHFTLAFQALGSLLLGFEALCLCVPDVFIDVLGCAFTYPTFRFIGRCIVACYVHYPFISSDMIDRVSERSESYNNASTIAQSSFLSNGKWVYYLLLAKIYGLAGRCAHLVFTNSTWTRNHIVRLWNADDKTFIVPPPCGSELTTSDGDNSQMNREKQIVSIGQFRPEKNHKLQLETFKLFLNNTQAAKDYKLIIIGGSRNKDDEDRVKMLKDYCTELGLDEYVEFKVNASFEEWTQYRKTAMIGLHTMRDEHFGIGIVECMASGIIMVAHNSAGPKMDILNDGSGFLAITCEEYADCLDRIVTMPESERLAIVQKAREKAKNFTDRIFIQNFNNHISPKLEETQVFN